MRGCGREVWECEGVCGEGAVGVGGGGGWCEGGGDVWEFRLVYIFVFCFVFFYTFVLSWWVSDVSDVSD